MKKNIFLCNLSLLLLINCGNAQQSITPSTTGTKVPGDPVKIESGLISGKLLPGNVKAYLGIPYAAPPVGELRWKEPQPLQPWTGIREANNYCAPCAQKTAFGGGPAPKEDCLYLNLWTPVNPSSDRLPVIVYIIGTGYRNGSASQSYVSGEIIAKKGVIFINFNYRLGVFGSLALPELTGESPNKCSGNYVHLDEIALLQWVHRNIEQFGGDPNNVTLMGQSSGGIDVCYLQASPLTKGLYNKVVGISGSTFPGGPWPATQLKVAEQEGMKYMQKLGVKSLVELRALPFEKLIEASIMGVEEPVGADGYVLPVPAPDMFSAQKHNKIPMLLNSCRDESWGLLAGIKTVEELNSTLQRLAGDKADVILKYYPIATDDNAGKTAALIAEESSTSKQMVQWANAGVNGKSPVYLSQFSFGKLAGHGMDIPYWLGTIILSGSKMPNQPEVTKDDIEMSEKMSNALIAFAKTGNPGTPAMEWPEYYTDNQNRLIIGENIKVVKLNKSINYFIHNPGLKLAW